MVLIPIITYFKNFYYNIHRCGNSLSTLYFIAAQCWLKHQRARTGNAQKWTSFTAPIQWKQSEHYTKYFPVSAQAKESCNMSFYCWAVSSRGSGEIISGIRQSFREFLPFTCLQFFMDTYFQAFSYIPRSQGHRHPNMRMGHVFASWNIKDYKWLLKMLNLA